MIKSVTATNYLGDSIKMELARPELSGFVIQSIDGLGPGKADINTTEVATNDGGKFNSARRSSRNIVLSLKYLWKSSIEDVRQASYKYFPLKKRVTLIFETDNRLAQIEGYVESNEPDIFSKSESAEVSIICPDPNFYSVGERQVTVFSGIEPLFEFPFSNESVSEPMLEIGAIRVRTANLIHYDGDVDVGITIQMHFVGEAKKIKIYNIGTREIMALDTDKIAAMTGSELKNGDDIIICTEKGNKSIVLVREGVTTNILNCLDKHVAWFTLTKGDNQFAFTSEVGNSNVQFTITNRVAYEGV